MLRVGDGALPPAAVAQTWVSTEVEWFTVERDGNGPVMAAVAEETWMPPESVQSTSLRSVLAMFDAAEAALILKAAHFAEWRRTSRYCGVCGTPTVPSESHTANECPSCGHRHFPKVSPAVIVQVTKGDQLLLGRSGRHPSGSYSVLAGFVDPGESLEETVAREIREEAGIDVKNIRYFGSQPWPFPDSLMVGFTAEYDSGDITNEDPELEDVAWFGVDELPPVPPAYSIARSLIDDFARSRGRDPATVPTWTSPRRR